jgi:hypothetical protein
MRHRGRLANTRFMASGAVASLCSKTISPASFKTQYALERSPRSNPMISCPSKMFFPLACIVLMPTVKYNSAPSAETSTSPVTQPSDLLSRHSPLLLASSVFLCALCVNLLS